jgi:ABC-type proline/glycine betaine transport system permease subunit
MSGNDSDPVRESGLGHTPHHPLHPRWVALIFLAVCVGLIPQIISLSSALSEVQLANHWRTAWVGLDVAEALIFLLTGWFIYRGSRLVSITASIAFAMLWLDAWFDVMTSVSPSEIATSRTLAVFVELPLGIFCLLVALRPLNVLRRPRWPRRRKRREDG